VSLSDHLPTPEVKGCKVSAVMARLDEDDRATLTRILANDSGYSNRTILAALRAEGHAIGRTTIQEHRAGACNCEPR
jgi:hypothetical protein